MQTAIQPQFGNPKTPGIAQGERSTPRGAALRTAAKVFTLIATLCFLPSVVTAQSPSEAGQEEFAPAGEACMPGSREPYTTDRDGLMLRVGLGPAAIGSTIEVNGNEVLTAGGGGAALSAQVGAALVPNLFLHGELFAVGTTHGLSRDDDGAKLEVDGLALGGAGAGLTYYFMPHNVSVGGTVMFAVSGVETESDLETESGEEFATSAGMLLKFQVDKQWQVNRWFGFGVGGAFFGGFGRGKTGSGDTLHAGYAGLSLQLVATYN